MTWTRRQFIAAAGAGSTHLFLGQRPALAQVENTGEVINRLAVENVTIIDATGKPAMPGMTVIISRDRIASIGRAGTTRVGADTLSIDGRGKFLIPGLWDMHTHLEQDWMPPLYLPNGVTGTRVPRGGTQVLSIRTSILEGHRAGPRMVVSGPMLDGVPAASLPGGRLVVTNAQEGREAVRKSVVEGADFIKVYRWLRRDAYYAIADESHKQGIPFVGHVPWSMTAIECSDAGQKSVEHTYHIEMPCVDGFEQWRQQVIQASDPPAVPMLSNKVRDETFDIRRATPIIERFRKNRTWLCPTLSTSLGLGGDRLVAENEDLKYAPPGIRNGWQAVKRNEPDLPGLRHQHDRYMEIVAAMHRGGVGLLPGTDSPIAFCVPGFRLHTELQLLAAAGLTPMEVLRTATYNPAKFFGKLNSQGTIAHGKLADVVLLDADPLTNISNTRKIHLVIAQGKLFRRTALDAALRAAVGDA